MPAELRFMRLFFMLLVGGDDILTNYLEQRRFKGADVQSKLRRAFGRVVAYSAKEAEAAQLAALPQLQKLDRAANPPPPLLVRKLRSVLDSPVGPLLPMALCYLVFSVCVVPVLKHFSGAQAGDESDSGGGQ